MNIPIHRFVAALSVAVFTLVALTDAVEAQEKQPQSEAAATSDFGVVKNAIRARFQQRTQLSENVRAVLQDAIIKFRDADVEWVPTEEVDSSLISDYWIGVQCEVADSTSFSPKGVPDTELTVNGGMKILAVTEGSAADQSGLEEGDVLLKFAGKDMDSLNALYAVVGETKDSEALMLVVRNKDLISLEITPQKRPTKEEDESAEVDHSHTVWLTSVGDAIEQEMQVKLIPKGYRLQVDMERGNAILLTVTKGDERWDVGSGSIEDLPEPIRETAADIFEKCEPMVSENSGHLIWHLTATPAFSHPQRWPLWVAGNGDSQLQDLRQEIKQLSEAVKKLESKLDD